MSQPWEEVNHTADWALRVRGADLRGLFENAARGMVSLIEGQADEDRPEFRREFSLQAPDLEVLLVDWLTALLVIVEDEAIVFTAVHVHEVAGLGLRAEARGRPGGAFQKHIKAVTYHNLNVRQTPEGYETVIVFDV